MYCATEMVAPTLNVFPSSSLRLRLELPSLLHSKLKQARFPFPSFSLQNPTFRPVICRASESPTVPPKKRSSNNRNPKNNSKKNSKSNSVTVDSNSISNSSLPPPLPTSLPKPPTGFVVDERGKVLSASRDRLATLVDPANNLPLECVVRREFKSSQGDDCMLLCPADMPIQILKNTSEGWLDVSDEELESILPSAAYALAKIRLYLVHSGYCYTARGGFCYSEEDIFDFHTDSKGDSLPTEGVEIAHFSLEQAHYMIYTPSDPLLFVAVKDQNGVLQIADDELLEDPAITSAIDEETEFNALVEEEAALLDSLLGKR
ncbi:hypothetical protein AAZX31_06G149800 [Glycine max]|uniref:uncharacterized protein n=1 Tax=Glycine max TaxID=3847 RepID=UPI000233A468|nr:uncharacterized protein LOC100778163 [Glycine max]XP_028236479.1 uncharacterized protein LOC114415819 [Glycine soja]KHN09642.1 hypothetical protein glysoja_011916 [Glycine soja]|eukprot:XP_003526881.1 uncharacterized protein LOC100778163 [Glycine max]